MKNLIAGFVVIIMLFPVLAFGQKATDCQIRIEGVLTEASCQGGMDGAISLRVSGGAAPYTYRWNTGQEVAEIRQLTAGTYRVTVQDAEGCVSTAEFPVTAQVRDLGLEVEQQAASGGTVLRVRFPGNTKPYAMTIKKLSGGFYGPQSAYTGQPLESGAYLLEAFTAKGCSVFERIKIEAN